jgi:hypothetical protein
LRDAPATPTISTCPVTPLLQQSAAAAFSRPRGPRAFLFSYIPVKQGTLPKQTLSSRAYRYVYPDKEIKALEERNVCPENDKLCQEAVWFTQNMFLGNTADMEQIAEAVRKVQKQAALLRHS